MTWGMSRATSELPQLLPEDEERRVRALVGEAGEQRAAKLLGISRHTLSRCLARLPLHRGTVSLVTAQLRGLSSKPVNDG
jgi:hypothetical protein